MNGNINLILKRNLIIKLAYNRTLMIVLVLNLVINYGDCKTKVKNGYQSQGRRDIFHIRCGNYINGADRGKILHAKKCIQRPTRNISYLIESII